MSDGADLTLRPAEQRSTVMALSPPRWMRLAWLILGIAGGVFITVLATASANSALFTRYYTELLVEEDEVDDLRTALREELAYRQFGQAVRLEVTSRCSDFLATTLLQEFDLPAQAMFRVPGLGAYFVSSITNRDYPLEMALVLMVTVAICIAYLLSDIAYALLEMSVK